MSSRIDWAALLKVEPDLPNKLNRAFFSLDKESRALRALIADLETAVAAVDGSVDVDLAAIEADIDALQAVDVTLDSRLDVLEALPTPITPVTIRGFRTKDQGAAFAAATTRIHWAGTFNANAGAFIVGTNSNGIQAAAGGMSYAYPETFEKAVNIYRLITRTNGRSGVAGGHVRMAVYANTTLASGAHSGSDYPGALIVESGNLAYPAGANAILETASLTAAIGAGSKAWFAFVQDAAGVTGAYSLPCYSPGVLYPFAGFTLDATTPTTIANDNATQGVCWRHSITYTGTESWPDPYPQTSPVVGVGGLTAVHPAVGYGAQYT